MADFIATTVGKSAIRSHPPISTLISWNSLMATILSNPWECTEYTSGGETLAGVRKTASYIKGSVIYKDTNDKEIGNVVVTGPDSTAFGTGLANILADTDLATAMGGTASHVSSEDAFSTTFTCHDANGEVYKVIITRTKITVSGYVDDAILTRIGTWANAQEILN